MVLTAPAADGSIIRAEDEGNGPAILIVHPGLDDGSRYKKVAARLATRFRVVRIHRRQYRLDLKANPKLGSPCTVADEVDDILALVRAIGQSVIIVGHSSGGVVALEAMLASPSSFAGGVIYEPSSVIGPKLAGEDGKVLKQARSALAAGRPGKAMAGFLREVIELPAVVASLAGAFTALVPRYRKLIPCQIDDLEAMDGVGVRLDAYASLDVPIVMLTGEKSPAHLRARVDAIASALPSAETVVMEKRNHGADLRAPDDVARVIEELADKVLR